MSAEKKKDVNLIQSRVLLCLENWVRTSPRVVRAPQEMLEPRIYCECYHIVYGLFAGRNVGQHGHVKELMADSGDGVGS